MAAVSDLLRRCRLEQYAAIFEELGYDDLEWMRSLSTDKLVVMAKDEIHMKPGHAARFADWIETGGPASASGNVNR